MSPKLFDCEFRVRLQISELQVHLFSNGIILPFKDYFGLCGRRQEWDVSREQHQNMYIICGETDHRPRLGV